VALVLRVRASARRTGSKFQERAQVTDALVARLGKVQFDQLELLERLEEGLRGNVVGDAAFEEVLAGSPEGACKIPAALTGQHLVRVPHGAQNPFATSAAAPPSQIVPQVERILDVPLLFDDASL